MIRILLVDDHPVARHGLKSLLLDKVKDAVIGEAPDATAALLLAHDGVWDLVIADLSMPGMSGLELIKELRRVRPMLPTLVLSMHPPSQFARRALSAGAIGYITKDSKLEEFVTAIESARRGRRYISRIRPIAASPGRGGSPPHESLSTEYQVLRLTADRQSRTSDATC